MSKFKEIYTELQEAPPKMKSGASKYDDVFDLVKKGSWESAVSTAKNSGDAKKFANDIAALGRAVKKLESSARVSIKVTAK